MRYYDDCKTLMSEIYRDVVEMGIIVKPKSMQNKNVEGNEDYITKELSCYQYNLSSLKNEEYLFSDDRCKEWAEAEFIERVDGNSYPIRLGNAWKIRREVWQPFLVKGQRGGKEFDYTYNIRLNSYNNINTVVNELKRNPGTRQAILPIFTTSDVANIGGKARIPCSMYYNFQIRPDDNDEPVLSIIYHQRSADVVTHFGNDIYLAWKMMVYISQRVGVKPGTLTHSIDSLHTYKKDWDKLEELRTNLQK